MIITLPRSDRAQTHLSAALACGPVQRDALHRVALVLKAAYALGDPDPAAVRPAQPAGSAEPIAVADEEPAGFGTGAQGELALRKDRCDTVVAGWLANPEAPAIGMEGQLKVDGIQWLTRTTPDATQIPGEGDAARNLFGWQPRELAPRRITPDPGIGDPKLPGTYTAAYENVYRRSTLGPTFATPGDRNTGALPGGAVIEVAQWRHGNQANALTYKLRTPALPGYVAQLRAWCGHGPDESRRWRLVDRIELRCDTLIVRPLLHQAVLIWRCDWNRELVTPAHWRAIQVLEAGA